MNMDPKHRFFLQFVFLSLTKMLILKICLIFRKISGNAKTYFTDIFWKWICFRVRSSSSSPYRGGVVSNVFLEFKCTGKVRNTVCRYRYWRANKLLTGKQLLLPGDFWLLRNRIINFFWSNEKTACVFYFLLL